jgi:hypothetical protein
MVTARHGRSRRVTAGSRRVAARTTGFDTDWVKGRTLCVDILVTAGPRSRQGHGHGRAMVTAGPWSRQGHGHGRVMVTAGHGSWSRRVTAGYAGAAEAHWRLRGRAHTGHGSATCGSRQCHVRVTEVSRPGHGSTTSGSRQCHVRVTEVSRPGHGSATSGSRRVTRAVS